MATGKREARSIKDEIRSIMTAVDNISDELRSSFFGVGNDICADKLDLLYGELRTVRNLLDSIDG